MPIWVMMGKDRIESMKGDFDGPMIIGHWVKPLVLREVEIDLGHQQQGLER